MFSSRHGQSFFAILIGFVASSVVSLLADRIGPTLEATPHRDWLIVSACLTALAVGIRLPGNVARTITSKFVRHRVTSPIARSDAKPDHVFLGTVVSTTAMLAGLGLAVTPVFAALSQRAFRAALERFFWIPPLLALVTYLAALVSGGVACVLIGVLYTSAYRSRPSDSMGAWPDMAWALSGAGAGCAVRPLFGESLRSPDVAIVLSSIPLFAMALLGMLWTGFDGTDSPSHPPRVLASARYRGESTTLLSKLAGLPVVSMAAVMALSARIDGGVSIAVLLWSASLGWAVGNLLARRGYTSVRGLVTWTFIWSVVAVATAPILASRVELHVSDFATCLSIATLAFAGAWMSVIRAASPDSAMGHRDAPSPAGVMLASAMVLALLATIISNAAT